MAMLARCRMRLVAAAGLLLGINLSARAEATTLFVAPPCSFPPRSPCGDDKNDGTSADTPLATLTKARDMLRAASDAEAKEVMLAEGLYELSEVLELTAADSGTVWAATGNVTLSGGEAMNPGWLKQVMNSDVLSQLPTDDARKHVRKVELWEHFLGDGVTLGNFSVRGSVNANAALTLDMLQPAGIEFFDPLDEVAYVPARYPNADASGGFSKIQSIKTGTNNTFTPEDDVKQRLPQWLPQRQFGHGSGDIWCHGYWSNRWSDAHYSLDSITDDGELVLGGVPEALADRTKEVCSGDCKPSKYDDGHKGGSYYCYNLLAELDRPGEMYLNRSSGALYIWPLNPAQYGFANITASKLQSVISISGGAKDIQLRGLHFRHTRDAAVVVRDTHDILIHGGSVGLAGSMGVNVSGGTNVTVSEVTVFGCGSGGVFLDGGDRPSLTPSGHSLIGSEIRNNSRWVYAMCPAVFLGGVNQSVRNTTISLHPHISVWVQGNDHTFEENNISDVCTWALDSGALYSGRDYTYRGNRVISNHFRNIRSMAGDDTQAVYLDDMMSGFLVSGNTFYNCSRALLLGGGRENEFSNNSIDGGDLLSPQNGIHFDNRGEGWDAKGCAPGGINYEFLARVPYTSEAWTKKYGDKLANILEDDICRPKYNKIEFNMYCNLKDPWIDASAAEIKKWGSTEGQNIPCNTK